MACSPTPRFGATRARRGGAGGRGGRGGQADRRCLREDQRGAPAGEARRRRLPQGALLLLLNSALVKVGGSSLVTNVAESLFQIAHRISAHLVFVEPQNQGISSV